MNFRSLAIALPLMVGMASAPALASFNLDIDIGVVAPIGVAVAPPPLPVYEQPPCPAPNYLWTPGYWAWGEFGYYWVPGTWVPAPAPNLLWTPGYWSWNNGEYVWTPGYWGPQIGYYGGINYGFGYVGSGFVGGGWSGGFFHYNTAFLNVNAAFIPNVYENPQPAPFYGGDFHDYRDHYRHNEYNHYDNRTYSNTTIINNHTTYVSNRYYNGATNRVSFAGGPNGVAATPNPRELMAVHAHHFRPSQLQQQHQLMAAQNRNYLATVNHGRPVDAALARPIDRAYRPAHFAAIQPEDHLRAQRAYGPARPIAPARIYRPATPAYSTVRPVVRRVAPQPRIVAPRPVMPHPHPPLPRPRPAFVRPHPQVPAVHERREPERHRE